MKTFGAGGNGWLRLGGAVRLSHLRQMVVSDYRLQERTSTARLDSVFRALIAYFGEECPASEITAEALATYAAERMRTRARGTVGLELRILRRAFRLAADFGLLTPPKFPHVRASDPRKGFFEDADLEAVLRHLPPDVAPLVEFLALTGWRKEEAVKLKWTQVDLVYEVVRLEPGTTKNREGRTFPFKVFPRLAALIHEQRLRCELLERALRTVIPWVFPRWNGKVHKDFRKAWKTACKAANVPGKLVHDLRRTAVRRLERAGVPRSVAMQLTGHRTEAVYRRYAIVNESDLSAGVQRLSDHMEAHGTANTKRPGQEGATTP